MTLRLFTVISPEDGSLNFLILGDWGGLPSSPYRTPTEKHIAAAMNRAAMERRTQFQIALGDNFYYSGVKDIHDPRFKVRRACWESRIGKVFSGAQKFCGLSPDHVRLLLWM